MPKNKEILARTRRPDDRSGPGSFLARLMTHALIGVRLDTVPSFESTTRKGRAACPTFLYDAPTQLLSLFLRDLLGSDEVEDNERKAARDEHTSQVDRIFHFQIAMEIHPDHQADADKHGQKAPLEAGKRIRPEPLLHGCPLEICGIDPFFDHRHALLAPVVEVYDEHPGCGAEEDNGDKEFAVHIASGSEFVELTFDGGFSNFDQSFPPKVSRIGRRTADFEKRP